MVDGKWHRKLQVDGVERSVNTGKNSMYKSIFINGILQRVQSTFAALLTDIALPTHVLFYLFFLWLLKSSVGWGKIFLDIEMYCFTKSSWDHYLICSPEA